MRAEIIAEADVRGVSGVPTGPVLDASEYVASRGGLTMLRQKVLCRHGERVLVVVGGAHVGEGCPKGLKC